MYRLLTVDVTAVRMAEHLAVSDGAEQTPQVTEQQTGVIRGLDDGDSANAKLEEPEHAGGAEILPPEDDGADSAAAGADSDNEESTHYAGQSRRRGNLSKLSTSRLPIPNSLMSASNSSDGVAVSLDEGELIRLGRKFGDSDTREQLHTVLIEACPLPSPVVGIIVHLSFDSLRDWAADRMGLQISGVTELELRQAVSYARASYERATLRRLSGLVVGISSIRASYAHAAKQ